MLAEILISNSRGDLQFLMLLMGGAALVVFGLTVVVIVLAARVEKLKREKAK